jgi:hypothetical protein
MIALKIPLAALICLVWWAIKQEPETAPSDDDGGTKRHRARPHPRKPFPRPPRRGPHGDPAPPSPVRVRTARVRARTLDH